MNACVLDASSSLAWVYDESGPGEALDAVLQRLDLQAPWLWRLEVVQAVTKKERQKRASAAEGTRLLTLLDGLHVTVVGEPADRSLFGLAALSRPHQLSAYDAVYLDLAIRRGLPLLTHDRNLREAAERVGVELVAVPDA